MSLEALAPDQRAVVQLVLQQERSYDDLAGLLGISAGAVRERAWAGLDRIGGPAGDLSPEERGEVADYLLGQQSVSRRGATRTLLADSPDARRWAREISGALAPVARSPLPAVPEDAEAEADVDDGIGAGTAALDAPASFSADEPVTPVHASPDEARAATREQPSARPKPRPRPSGSPTGRPGGGDAAGDRPRSSKLGGALLIGGVSVILAALVIFLFTRDDNDTEPAPKAAATATATATASVEPAAVIPLKAVKGAKGEGAMAIFVSGQQIAFTIEATGVTPSAEGEAYAVWLTGGGKAKRLGFAPTVGEDGKLGVSGPRESDAANFPERFSSARKVIVTREKSQDAASPGPVVLGGAIPRSRG